MSLKDLSELRQSAEPAGQSAQIVNPPDVLVNDLYAFCKHFEWCWRPKHGGTGECDCGLVSARDAIVSALSEAHVAINKAAAEPYMIETLRSALETAKSTLEACNVDAAWIDAALEDIAEPAGQLPDSESTPQALMENIKRNAGDMADKIEECARSLRRTAEGCERVFSAYGIAAAELAGQPPDGPTHTPPINQGTGGRWFHANVECECRLCVQYRESKKGSRVMFQCAKCKRSPADGITVVRRSPKGQPFVGICTECEPSIGNAELQKLVEVITTTPAAEPAGTPPKIGAIFPGDSRGPQFAYDEGFEDGKAAAAAPAIEDQLAAIAAEVPAEEWDALGKPPVEPAGHRPPDNQSGESSSSAMFGGMFFTYNPACKCPLCAAHEDRDTDAVADRLAADAAEPAEHPMDERIAAQDAHNAKRDEPAGIPEPPEHLSDDVVFHVLNVQSMIDRLDDPDLAHAAKVMADAIWQPPVGSAAGQSAQIVNPPDMVSVPRQAIVAAVHYLGESTDPDVVQVIADLTNAILDANAAEPAGCDHRWVNVTAATQRCCECAMERARPAAAEPAGMTEGDSERSITEQELLEMESYKGSLYARAARQIRKLNAAEPAGVMLVTAARTIRKALKLSRFGMNHAKANLIDHGDLFENALKSIDDAFATLRKPPICEECNQPMETHWTCPTVARKIEAQSCCDRATNAAEPAGRKPDVLNVPKPMIDALANELIYSNAAVIQLSKVAMAITALRLKPAAKPAGEGVMIPPDGPAHKPPQGAHGRWFKVNPECNCRLCREYRAYQRGKAAAEPSGQPEQIVHPPELIKRVLDCTEFRGLWHSRTMHEDGRIETGWSVTFVLDGDYCEVPYQRTSEEACRQALCRIGNPVTEDAAAEPVPGQADDGGSVHTAPFDDEGDDE